MTFTALSEIGEYKHLLAINEMPSHNHTIKSQSAQYNATSWEDKGYQRSSQSNYTLINGDNIGLTGGNQSHNNIQPSIAVYFWRRKS